MRNGSQCTKAENPAASTNAKATPLEAGMLPHVAVIGWKEFVEGFREHLGFLPFKGKVHQDCIVACHICKIV